MEFPSWFQSAIQGRLDHVIARIERHPDVQKLRNERQAAFHQLELGMDKQQKSSFLDWEEKQNFALAVQQEVLYLQGLKDGAQLACALLESRGAADVGDTDVD